MTATSEVRFGADGTAKVQSYVRLTDSTCIRCCTYDDAAPILTIQRRPGGDHDHQPRPGRSHRGGRAVRPSAGRSREPVRGRAGKARRHEPRDGSRRR